MHQASTAFPLADADKCVKCALCLPHCPTYRESLDEGESPRGRIALMQGFATGALDITSALTGHLDRCLACRACEAVCPAEVPYGKLIDAARANLILHGHQESMLVRLFAVCMRHPVLLHLMHYKLWLTQKLGLQKLASMWPRLRRLARILPPLARPRRWQPLYRASHGGRQEVTLFLGCIARITQPQVTRASIQLLNALGYSVRIPEGQTCCGALDQHAGRTAHAAILAIKNLEAFSTDATVPVLNTASGCGATLGEYPSLLSDKRAATFSKRSQDISAFLVSHAQLKHIRFKPLTATVLLHSPCTLKNVLKADKAVAELLRCIPQLKLEILPASAGCCGSAGSYVMSEPEIADRLADNIVATVKKVHPAILVTSNVGCSLHLRAALQRHGLKMPVLHPLELLAKQLPNDSDVSAIIHT
ncbi:MAG TPA: (Fe-S)-binding protein [Gammaproteobacteria bacterium]|nr:(Fe-S)-binding protein [Gammaproteobacteria bacterium]